jgi:hypothetical protein
MVKHRQLAPTVGHLANDHQKNPMAPLDDSPVLEKGTFFCIGSRIFVVDESGNFVSCPIDQTTPEALEAAKCHEFDAFIDQLEEVGFSALDDSTRIRRNQSQNTLRVGRGLGKTDRRFQARNSHRWKGFTSQLYPLR